MMKARLSVGLVAGVALAWIALAAQATDREREGLVGPVRTLREVPDSASGTTLILGFDRSGNESQRSYRGPSGYRHIEQLRDPAGRLIESVVHESDGSISGRTRYLYSGGGRLLEEIQKSESMTTGRVVYRYDPAGRVAEKVSYAPDRQTVRLRIAYRYDQAGRKTEAVIHDPHPTDLGSGDAVEAYEEHGLVKERVQLAPDGTPTGRSDFRYKFDSRGNWIEKVEERFTRNPETGQMVSGGADVFTRRDIEYYE